MSEPKNAFINDKIFINEAKLSDLQTIQQIAEETWPVAYGNILSAAQLRYMLDKMYSIASLEQQLQNGHHFLLASIKHVPAGFASYTFDPEIITLTKLQKLYVLPQQQGKNVGKNLLTEIVHRVKLREKQQLNLNVNRANPAVNFYRKFGFEIVYSEDIAIGNGYFMNDYVMALKL